MKNKSNITLSTSNEVNLSGLVDKPHTQKQVELLNSVCSKLSLASYSAVISHAIDMEQIEKGFKGTSTGSQRQTSDVVTTTQAQRLVKAFPEQSEEAILATKMPYQTAYDIVGAVIKAEETSKELSKPIDYSEALSALKAQLEVKVTPEESTEQVTLD